MTRRRKTAPARPAADGRLDRRTLLKRSLAAAAGGVLATRLLASSAAFAARLPPDARIRIAMVLPGTTGTVVNDAALFDIVGDAARIGASMADSDITGRAQDAGHRFEMLMGHSPNADTAYRTGERMVAVEEVTAIVGGLGFGQAEALARVAEERGVLFFNVGDGDDRLRAEGGPFVFHVEASNAMYLDALVDWHSRGGGRSWFVLHDPEALPGVAERARRAVDEFGAGGTVVGEAEVRFGQPVYEEEMAAIREAGADAVLLAVDVRDEILLRQRLAGMPGVGAVAALPNAVSQTRDFIAASRVPADERPDHRLMLWETTLDGGAAGDLNERFTTRTGQPMDPSGWATYQAAQAFYQAAVEAGSVAPEAVAERLTDPDFALESTKGAGVSFRPWNRQLRQPLYVIETDPAAEWGPALSRKVAVAGLAAVLPDADESDASAYDRYGNGPDDSPP